jgi:hypothetical protein
MQLIDVLSATYTQHGPGVVDCVIVADLDDGYGVAEYGFTLTRWDDFGLSPDVNAWMAAHPDFPVADYVPPPPSDVPQIDPEVEKAALLANIQRDVERLRQLGVDV